MTTAIADPIRTDDDPAADAPTADAAPAAAVEGAHPASEEAMPALKTRRRRWPFLVCAVLIVAGFSGTGYFGSQWLAQRSSAAETAQVRTTSAEFVTALTNFDPGTVDADFARIQHLATGSFATQARQFFGSSIRQQLQAAGAASRGQVLDLFIEALSGSQATVFAVVDQTYLNSKMTSPTADTLRLELVLSDGSSGWLVSTVTVVQSPAGFPGSAAPSGGTGGKGGKG
jgi:hypothetical protein